MINIFTIISKISLILLYAALSWSCQSTTEESIDVNSQILPNGKHLVVEKTNIETTSIGIFTKHYYGTTRRYSYKLLLEQDDISWDGKSGEPKQLLFCKDGLYIRYLKKKRTQTIKIDTLDHTKKYESYWEIKAFYQKHIDERYFFNWFGKDYWVTISPEQYSSIKQSCDEFSVPNDNELLLETTE